jgi:hypothetical protein
VILNSPFEKNIVFYLGERFRNIQEWWDVTKTKIKYLTMQISKQLKKGQNKKDKVVIAEWKVFYIGIKHFTT